MRVVLIGPPGAGKGTQAKLLQERFAVPHISTGDMLREAGRAETSVGAEVRRYLESGQLVPDQTIIRAVEERLRHVDCGGGFVLDGFPRTVAQAEALAGFLGNGHALDGALYIRVPRAELVRRLAGRRVCERCGTMFHLVFDPPATPGVCSRCGGTLVQRADDSEVTVQRRLDVYDRETGPVIEWYRQAGQLREADGMGTRDQVFGRVAELVQ